MPRDRLDVVNEVMQRWGDGSKPLIHPLQALKMLGETEDVEKKYKELQGLWQEIAQMNSKYSLQQTPGASQPGNLPRSTAGLNQQSETGGKG